MKFYIPVKLKMAYNPFKPVKISEENPQQVQNLIDAFDKVIDPSIEFHVPSESHDKSPDDSYNLPTKLQRKGSSVSLYTKLDYFIDRNELPKVHRSLSNQSLVVDGGPKNILTNFDLGSLNNVHILANNSVDNISLSENSVTPVPELPNENNLMRNSPERYETGSNNSFNSNLTQGSLLSIISDIEENTYKNNNEEYENIIKDLKLKLQEKEVENDQFKFALKDLDWKTELKWQEKYQELLRQKANCEGQLNTVQLQYENLLKLNTIKNEKNNIFEEHTKLQLKINNLEKINSELNSNLILRTNESKQWRSEISKIENENEKLRINLQETKIDLDSKNSVLQSLKNKITEQHIELQNQVQSKLKLNNFFSTLNNEMETVKKSEKWYIEQLHACQYAKSKIQQELMSIQSNILTNSQNYDKLKREVLHWKNLCEETKIKAIKEKEKLLRRMENIEADLIEKQMLNNDKKEIVEVKFVENNILEEELNEKVDNLNKIILEKDELITQLNKQSTDLLVRVTTLQKILNEKEFQYQTLENSNSDLNMKCNNYSENMRTKENIILDLRNKIVNLEVSLHAASKEKQEIDETIKIIREDFNKFMKSYNNMKKQLDEKTKIINNFECEKQELFMENNWKVCEIEDLHHKILNNKVTEAEFLELKNIYNETVIEKDKLIAENNSLKEQFSELNNETDINKLKETLCTRETQLFNQTQNCELLNSEIIEKDEKILKLSSQIEQQELILNNANFKTSELKDINISLEIKIQELYKKIRDCNFVIDQFNNLCRNSELERHDLLLKLQQIQTEQITNENELKCQNNFETIKNLFTKLFDNLIIEDFNLENFYAKTIEYLNKLLDIKYKQNEALEINNKLIKTLKNKLFTYKNKISHLEQRCNFAVNNLEEINNKIILIHNYVDYKNNLISTGTQTKNYNSNEENETTNSNPQNNKNKYDKTNRTLLRKLKEELKSRKSAEKALENLQETYNLAITEINNIKLENNRTNIEFETLKTRCQEYKDICDKQNQTILILEQQKGASESKENMECNKCLELKKLKEEILESNYKLKILNEKLEWYEKEINDKDKGITELKKQLFNEKIQVSAMKKQVSSVQMCLDNANSLLDTKLVEFNQLTSVCEKLEKSKTELSELLESEQAKNQENKTKLDNSLRSLEEKSAKDELLADEIKTLSCHLHQKNLEVKNAEIRIEALESEHSKKLNCLDRTISELQNNLSEIQFELEGVRNDKFFLQRLCADLKMSLQGTINQNKVLQERLEILQTETNNLNNKLESLPPSEINDEYIYKLLKESTVSPDKPLLNLRSCLDSLKNEMAILQKEIIAKTQNNV